MDIMPEERIKKIVEAVMKEMFPPGSYEIGISYRINDRIQRLYCIVYSLTEPVNNGTITFSHEQLDETDSQLERMAQAQIKSSISKSERIRIQILKAQSGRKLCQDLYLMEKLSLLEKDRKEAVGEDSCSIKS